MRRSGWLQWVTGVFAGELNLLSSAGWMPRSESAS
jgi:hypothetical protein